MGYHAKGYLYEKNSIGEAIVGQLIPWKDSTGGPTFTRPIIVFDSLEGVSAEMHHDYKNKSIMSFDGLIRPVSIDGEGGLNPYIAYTSGDYHTIKQDDLNPLANPSGWNRDHVARDRSDTHTIGHDFEIVARTGTLEDSPEFGLIMPPTQTGSPDLPDYENNYRFMALRGPLVMAGWGYDVCGYPVPNKIDVVGSCESGIFDKDYSGLHQTKFLDNHLRKSKTWAVAPVDLRLDKYRGIWTAGDRIYKGIAQEAIVAGSSGDVVLSYAEHSGHQVNANLNWAHNDQDVAENDQLFVYYFAEEQKYVIIGRECPPAPESSPLIVGDLWTPDQIGDQLIFWVSAVHANTYSGMPMVKTWFDLSGNDRDAYSDYGFSGPSISLWRVPQVLHFDWQQYMTAPSGVLIDISGHPEISMFTMTTPTARTQFALTPPPTLSGEAIYDTESQQLAFYYDPSGSGDIVQTFGGASDTIALPFDINQPHLIELIRTTGDLSYWIDAVTDLVNHAAGTAFDEPLLIAKSVAQTGVIDSYSGDFMEIVVFSGALDSTTREKMEGYLAHKYSSASLLPGGHPYEIDPPYV